MGQMGGWKRLQTTDHGCAHGGADEGPDGGANNGAVGNADVGTNDGDADFGTDNSRADDGHAVTRAVLRRLDGRNESGAAVHASGP